MNTVRTVEFGENGRLLRLEAAASLPGDIEVTFWFREGEFGQDWRPLPDDDTVGQPGWVERFRALQRGFTDAVATLVGTPVLLADGHVSYPIVPEDMGTVH